MWQQWWVVEAADEAAARRRVAELLAQWTPRQAGRAEVGGARFYAGPDDFALGEQYEEEVREIQGIVASTPREEWARRFHTIRQRGVGIPPRPGWVVAAAEGPRSPRPLDWAGAHGPRWVVTVDWPGSPPGSA